MSSDKDKDKDFTIELFVQMHDAYEFLTHAREKLFIYGWSYPGGADRLVDINKLICEAQSLILEDMRHLIKD